MAVWIPIGCPELAWYGGTGLTTWVLEWSWKTKAITFTAMRLPSWHQSPFQAVGKLHPALSVPHETDRAPSLPGEALLG